MPTKKHHHTKHHAKHHKTHHVHHRTKQSSNWIPVGVILLLLLGFIFASANYEVSDTTMTKPQPTDQYLKPTSSAVTLEEQRQIDQWIINNDLNQYGDPKDTAYAGGTPLFDEKTGTYQNLYDYILQKHPDRPWKK